MPQGACIAQAEAHGTEWDAPGAGNPGLPESGGPSPGPILTRLRSRRSRVFPEASAAGGLGRGGSGLRSAGCDGGQGRAAVRRVEAAAVGPLHCRLAGRWQRTLPHRESAHSLRGPPAGRAQPRFPRRLPTPLRCLLLPRSGCPRPSSRRLGLGLGGRRRLGRRIKGPSCLDPAACLGP